ncbi:MAG: glycosyltransferase [Actinomycetota bacterium]|nr:glycosyltransferase [Actinomycetota bacterium]
MSRPPEARLPVAVVVATYDRPALLPACLASIAAALSPDDELVVSEAGDSRARDAVGGLGRPAEVVTVAATGKCRQLNLGVAATTAPIVAFTDDDCRVEPGWVDGLAASFDDPQVGIAFGPVRGLTHLPGDAAAGPPPGEAPFVTWTYAHGASFAVRREALFAAGGFDERLGPGAPGRAGEDHDVLLRIRERGWRVAIADTPPVEHLEWRDEEESDANALVYERGAGAFLGAAVRRSPRRGWPLLKHRLGYARQLVADRPGDDRRFAWRAVRSFAGGLVYGVRLRPWPGPRS